MKAVLDAPMEAKMIQAFMRDVTGRMDVTDMQIARVRPGLIVVIQPGGPNIAVEVGQLRP